jgi:uncharacterized protein (DUF983 family)
MHENVIYGGEDQTGRVARPLWPAMRNGMMCRCPRCGEGHLFRSYLKIVDKCEVCDEELFHHRADDFPAYLVVFIAGHLIVGAFVAIEAVVNLPLWLHLSIWLPPTVVFCLLLLRPVKGAVVGLQWAFYMLGFGGEEDALDTHPELEG